MPAKVAISAKTHAKLNELATMTNLSASAVLDEAVDAFYRRLQLESLNRDYARLRRNPKVWAQTLKERQLWDQTNMDGIEVDDA